MEKACQALKSAVSNFIRKCDQKERQGGESSRKRNLSSSDSISKIVDHACYWLRQMVYKRQSLQLGIQALVEHVRQVTSSHSQLQQLSKPDFSEWLSSWLQHVFDQYLRLRDGVVLLTSGECRHEGDITQSQSAESKRFRSRLKSTSTRPDGYTVLYRGEHYCGYSWDEGMDPDVGIQHRLQKALWQYFYNSSSKKKKKTAEELWEQHILEKAPMYGLVLDQQEVHMNRAQKELEDFRQTLDQDLNRMMRSLSESSSSSSWSTSTSNIRVVLVVQEKMERLEVTMGKTTSMVIERRANQFQIQDERGVLPNRMTLDEWLELMTFPLAPPVKISTTQVRPTKKQKTQHEPSDTGNATNQKLSHHQPMTTTTTASGLVVRTKIQTKSDDPSANSNIENDHNSSSITDIKRQLGIDVHQLEEGRAILEAEEELALQDAQAIDINLELEEEESDLHHDIEHQKRLAEYLQSTKLPKILKAQEAEQQTSKLRQQKEFMLEAWDIREALRQSYMTIGNDWLALHSIHHERLEKPSTSSTTTTNASADQPVDLNRALDAFQQALHWVCEQERSLASMTPMQPDQRQLQQRTLNDDDFDPAQLRIITLLYRGRAHTNVGIVLYRQWQESFGQGRNGISQAQRKLSQRHEATILLRRSMEELDRALESVNEMLRESQVSRIDRVLGNQLKALTSRWMGTALWHQGDRPKAVSIMLEQGCDPVWVTDDSLSTTTTLVQLWRRALDEKKENVSNMQDDIEFGVECYYNCTCLADLAGEALEAMVLAAKGNKEGNKTASQELLSWSKRALLQAANVSKTITALITLQQSTTSSASPLSLDNYDVKTPHELEVAQQELVDWWKEVTEAESTRLDLPKRSSAKHLPRNDVLGEGPAKHCDPNLPKKRFVVRHDEGEQWRKQRRRQKRLRSGSLSRKLRLGIDDDFLPTTTMAVPSKRQYRKWGDQLLPQIEIAPGTFVPRIVYPAVAPEMPPEIRRIMEKLEMASRP